MLYLEYMSQEHIIKREINCTRIITMKYNCMNTNEGEHN